MSSSNSDGSVRPIAPAMRRKHSRVADRLAERLDRGLVPSHPQVAPRGGDVVGLDVGGGREHDVGVLGGVGEELLVDDGEQVVAGHALASALGVGHDHERVAVPHDHRPHRRLLVEQDLAEPAHVERARLAPGEQVGAAERGAVDELALPRADAAHQPAAAVAPRTGQRRQAGQRAVEHRPVLVVLGTDQGADRGRAGGGVLAGEGARSPRRRRRTRPRPAPASSRRRARRARRSRACARRSIPRRSAPRR